MRTLSFLADWIMTSSATYGIFAICGVRLDPTGASWWQAVAASVVIGVLCARIMAVIENPHHRR